MQPPDELMVDAFLPAIRSLVARRLRSEGLSQSKISAALGVTQASVSGYLSSDASKSYSSLALFSLSSEEADRYASLLSDEVKRDPVYAVDSLLSIWTNLLGNGRVCPPHRRVYPSLAQCEVCIREFGSRQRPPADSVGEVAKAVEVLESSPAFVSMMPEVSVNLACVSGDSDSPEDVVAIPGRIVKVKGVAKAMNPPARGSSRHLSRVLLLVRRRRPDFRAAINLRYDERVSNALHLLGLRRLEIGGYRRSHGEDPTLEALKGRLLASRAPFDCLTDSGSRGIEPSLYLFAADAVEVARLAVKVAELYSAD